MKISDKDARWAAKKLGIDLRKLPAKKLRKGMAVELEHGRISARTNVSDDDLIVTAKIALAHIVEIPDYYERLDEMEKEAKKYWGKNHKFDPFK